jgi:hypothetical protein
VPSRLERQAQTDKGMVIAGTADGNRRVCNARDLGRPLWGPRSDNRGHADYAGRPQPWFACSSWPGCRCRKPRTGKPRSVEIA